MLEGNNWEAARLLAEVRDFGEREIDGAFVTVREIVFHAQTAMLNQLTGDCAAAVRETAKVLECCSVLKLQGAAIAATPDLEISRIMVGAVLGANGMMVQAESVLDDLVRNAHEQYRRDLAAWTSAALNDRNVEPSDDIIEHAKGIVELIRRALESVEEASLTRTERRVLESVALGRSSKEIAAFTGKSVKTVDNHVAAILRKLQAHSRGEAVARARRTGLLTDEHGETVKA
jgi:DNA-binding NarL/FixJ family response regulator